MNIFILFTTGVGYSKLKLLYGKLAEMDSLKHIGTRWNWYGILTCCGVYSTACRVEENVPRMLVCVLFDPIKPVPKPTVLLIHHHLPNPLLFFLFSFSIIGVFALDMSMTNHFVD